MLNLVENTCKDSFDLFFGLYYYNTYASSQLQNIREALSQVYIYRYINLTLSIHMGIYIHIGMYICTDVYTHVCLLYTIYVVGKVIIMTIYNMCMCIQVERQLAAKEAYLAAKKEMATGERSRVR